MKYKTITQRVMGNIKYISEEGIQEFEKKIKEMLDDNWKLQGGVSVIKLTENGLLFSQSMIKE